MTFFQEHDLARFFGLTREYLVEEAMENRSGFIGDEKIQAPADQKGTLDFQESCAGEIDCPDSPYAVQSIITHRSEVIKFAVSSQESFHLLSLGPRLQEFFVLQLQLDLMDLQLVDQPL